VTAAEPRERLLTAPFLALAWTITYYELRDLKGAEPTAAV